MIYSTCLLCLILLSFVDVSKALPTITGELKKWHTVTLTFDGPQSNESATPNPFSDYRLVVNFKSNDSTYAIPGFFAADGDAANTGATQGNKWKVRFVPDAVGRWNYSVSFRSGNNIAVDFNASAGNPLAFDGDSGSFVVNKSDKSLPDFRASGMLRIDNQTHFLKHQDTGKYFLKAGPGDPENFLAYTDFDQTPAAKHGYGSHIQDWKQGDPSWATGKGKGIIGAINYMSSVGINTHYLLTMNVGGDGNDVWPWIGAKQFTRFDCSKLDQWEIVFDHMTRRGINIHLLQQEQESDQLLNKGELGLERKLYYRELIARFGHHLALIWNLGEENTNTHAQRKQYADFMHALDAYHHPVVAHTYPKKQQNVYSALLGHPTFNGVSLHTSGTKSTRSILMNWRKRSADAGKLWILASDEASSGGALRTNNENADQRQNLLLGSLMAGGYGAEYYMGMPSLKADLDYRSYSEVWEWSNHTLSFFRNYVPFWEMAPDDSLASSGWVLASPNHAYVIYLKSKSSDVEIDLTASNATDSFNIRWYSPQKGGNLLVGTTQTIDGGEWQSIGNPPSLSSFSAAKKKKEWLVLVLKV